MRRIVTTALSLLAVYVPAVAADLPPSQPPPLLAALSWTGPYVGLNAGAAFGNGHDEFNIAGFQPPSFSTSLTGALGGAEAGYNWQTGPLVVGLEGAFYLSGLRGSRTTPCIAPFCGALAATFTQ